MTRPPLAADLVVVDVGNSKTLVVLFERGRERLRLRLDAAPGVRWDRASADLVTVLVEAVPRATRRQLRVVVASVAPRRTAPFLAACRRRGFRRIHIGRWDDPWPFALGLRRPETVGTDRLANLAGLWTLGARRGVVVDAGTAVTIDVLDAGRFAGGLILPGFDLALAALAGRTEKLPALGMGGTVPRLGRDTRAAMRAGVHDVIRLGIGAVVRRLAADLGPGAPVVLTGGAAPALRGAIPSGSRSEPDLLLLGLCLLASGLGPDAWED